MSDKPKSNPIADNLDDLKQVGGVAKQAAGQAREAGTDAVKQAKDVAQEAKEHGVSLAGDVKESVTSAAEGQKDKLAGLIDSLADSVHRSGKQLEGEQDWIAKLIERGAGELGSLADTLRTNDLPTLVGNLDGLARRQPALFLGATVIAGFALARAGKVAVSGALPMEGKSSGPPASSKPSQAKPSPEVLSQESQSAAKLSAPGVPPKPAMSP